MMGTSKRPPDTLEDVPTGEKAGVEAEIQATLAEVQLIRAQLGLGPEDAPPEPAVLLDVSPFGL